MLQCYTGEVLCIRGRNPALATSLENMSDLSLLINYSVVNPTAAKLQLSSSSTADKGTPTVGTGAQKVLVIGLDSDYNLLSEEVTLDGQNQVETTNSFLRVFAAGTTLGGSSFANAGDIYIIKTGTGGTITAGVPGTLTSGWIKILVGYGYGTSGIYTVPRGKTIRLERVHLSCRSQQGDFVLGVHNPTSTTDNTLKYAQHYSIGAPNAVDYTYPLPTSLFFGEKTDIYLRGSSASANGVASMSCFFRQIGGAQRGGVGVSAPQ